MPSPEGQYVIWDRPPYHFGGGGVLGRGTWDEAWASPLALARLLSGEQVTVLRTDAPDEPSPEPTKEPT